MEKIDLFFLNKILFENKMPSNVRHLRVFCNSMVEKGGYYEN